MTAKELILMQIKNLRDCYKQFKEDAAVCVQDKNSFEREEALAGTRIIQGYYFNEETGEKCILSNDYARKAFIKEQTVTFANTMNLSKEAKEASDKKVEVEISVLSALKQIAINENFDDDLLAKYDILGEENDGI